MLVIFQLPVGWEKKAGKGCSGQQGKEEWGEYSKQAFKQKIGNLTKSQTQVWP